MKNNYISEFTINILNINGELQQWINDNLVSIWTGENKPFEEELDFPLFPFLKVKEVKDQFKLGLKSKTIYCHCDKLDFRRPNFEKKFNDLNGNEKQNLIANLTVEIEKKFTHVCNIYECRMSAPIIKENKPYVYNHIEYIVCGHDEKWLRGWKDLCIN